MDAKMEKYAGLYIIFGITLLCVGVVYKYGIGPGLFCYGSFWTAMGAIAVAYMLDKSKGKIK